MLALPPPPHAAMRKLNMAAAMRNLSLAVNPSFTRFSQDLRANCEASPAAVKQAGQGVTLSAGSNNYGVIVPLDEERRSCTGQCACVFQFVRVVGGQTARKHRVRPLVATDGRSGAP